MTDGELEPADPGSLELVAAALRANTADLAVFGRVLTSTLGSLLPAGMVQVQRERSFADRLAGRPGTPVAVRVATPERVLELRTDRRGPSAEVHQVVRGVVISRRQVSVDEWVRILAGELTALAARDEAARAALQALLEG